MPEDLLRHSELRPKTNEFCNYMSPRSGDRYEWTTGVLDESGWKWNDRKQGNRALVVVLYLVKGSFEAPKCL